MRKGTTEAVCGPAGSAQDVLTGILREGAQRLLAQPLSANRPVMICFESRRASARTSA